MKPRGAESKFFPTPTRSVPPVIQTNVRSNPPLVLFFDPDSLVTDGQTAALLAGGFRISSTDNPEKAWTALDGESLAAVVIVEGARGPRDDGRFLSAAKTRGIPVLGLVESGGGDPSLHQPDAGGYDAWVHHNCAGDELRARLNLTLSERPNRDATTMTPPPIPIDVRLLAMIVHDVRNPLNVIGLTLRVIEQIPAQQREAIREDLGFLRDNAGQIEKMLTLVSDLCRLSEPGPPPETIRIDPARFVEEVLNERAHKGTENALPARFESDPSTPASVVLNPPRARLALLSALNNALVATDRPLSVRTSGKDDRWTITIGVDTPPPATVVSYDVNHQSFERLLAIPAERRGLELAIAGWLSAQFGGSVRLEVRPDEGSSIVIDWPIEMA